MVSQPQGCWGPDSAGQAELGELPHPLAVAHGGRRGRRGEVPSCSALAFICRACSCKCGVFTNAGIARSLELCPSTKEALKRETRCHGMFQASSTRLNQIIAVSASAWKKQQVLSKSFFFFPPLDISCDAEDGRRGLGMPGQRGQRQDDCAGLSPCNHSLQGW